MALFNWFTEGYDPTGSVTCITRSELLQMVHEARPAAQAFMGVESDTAPDVVTYPDLANAIWAETLAGEKTGNFYWYDGATWQPWKLQAGTLTGDLFANYSIEQIKIAITGGAANQVRALNGAANAWVWANVVDLIQANSIAISKIVAGAEGATMLVVGGVWTTTNLTTYITDLIADVVIPASHLFDDLGTLQQYQVYSSAGPNQFLVPAFIEDLARDNQFARKKLKWETVTTTSTAGVVQIDGAVCGSYYLDLTENVTDFQVSLTEGQSVTVAIKQHASSAYTVAFNSAIKWPGGTAPTMTATNSHVDVFTFIQQNGVIRASAVQNFAL